MPIRKPVRNRRPLQRGLGSVLALLFALPAVAEERLRLAQAGAPAAEEPAAEEPAAAEAEQPAPGPPPGVEEIVVRGGASEVLEDFSVADSVTAFSAADLVALGAANIADLAAFTPNLEIVTAGATTPTFFIRGVGLNDFNANSTGAVAVYQDDVPMNAPALQLATLFDMESVNVLRGPQGTGLARNSSAGAIKLYARKPTGQFNGYLQGEGGNFDAQDYQGAVEAPIFEDLLSARLAFRFTDRDGTMRNRCGNAPAASDRVPRGDLRAEHKTATSDPWSICGEPVGLIDLENEVSDIPTGLPDWVNDRHNWAGRGTLRFEPTLDLSFVLGGHGQRRNELSRLGQSIGTTGQQFCLGSDIERCDEDFPKTRPDGTTGTRIVNALSGIQGLAGEGYQPIEIKQHITQLAPCYQLGFGFNLSSNPPPGGPGGCASAGDPAFPAYERAVQLVARDLARNLDDEPWKGDFNRIGRTRNDTFGASLKSQYVLPYDLELTAVSAYDRYFRKIDIDLDFSPQTLFHIITRDDGYQLYQDLDLAGESAIVGESPVRWNVGGWVLPEKLDVNQFNDFGRLAGTVGLRDYTQRMLSLGGYGSFEFDFWDDFTLDGGVRYNWERKDIDYLLQVTGNPAITLDEHDVWQDPTGTLRLTYRFREDTQVYWKYNRGWKPGHYNATGSPLTGITIAEPEVIDAWETGLHAEWFGGFLAGDLSLFYYNYQDYQIFTVLQFADTAPEFVVINANDAEVYGAEIEGLLRPWAGGYVNVRFGWLETQFLDFLITQQTRVQVPGAGQVVIERELQNSGNPLLNSPRYKVSITAEQAIPLGKYGYLIPRYDGAWTATTYYDASQGRGIPNRNNNIQYLPKDTIAQRAYWIHTLRLGYRTPDGRLEVAGWVRNLQNRSYKTFAFDGSTFFATTIYFVGDPRTYGGTVTVTF